MSVTIAIDTSTALTCVGLSDSDGAELELFDVPEEGERPRHATVTLALLSQVLDEAGRDWSDISKVVVGLGPGSFTGLRVGIATAIGIARGVGAETKGVSGLTALLAGLDEGQSGCAMIDARRGELFVATSESPTSPRCLSRDLVGLDPAELSICIGDGAILEQQRLRDLGLEVPEAGSPLHRISPLRMISTEASGHGFNGLDPLYVRDADAVPTAERTSS